MCVCVCVCIRWLQEQISRVQVTASQIEELVPQLLTAAEMAATGPSPATMEHLNLLSQEWATKVEEEEEEEEEEEGGGWVGRKRRRGGEEEEVGGGGR